MIPIQAKLDIVDRSRTSLLPWRGQFSPELVEHLIDTFCPRALTLVDPFCGSGTVLAEAMRSGRRSVGIDINPAAYVLSSFCTLLTLSIADRRALAAEANRLVAPFTEVGDDLFARNRIGTNSIADIISNAESPQLRLLLHVAALIGCGDSTDLPSWKLVRGLRSTLKTLERFETQSGQTHVVLGDARFELRTHECDAIVTSPPYINVFNYHQNYRPIMEHLGWEPLSCAVAEIGANRKHRQNRFLTVVQYCLDMSLLFREAVQALRSKGVFIIVLGRESNVLRTPLYNSNLIDEVAKTTGGLAVISRHERVFRNRFGAAIYEDILVFKPTGRAMNAESDDIEAARCVGIKALSSALERAPKDSVVMIEQAITGGVAVRPSAQPTLAKAPLWLMQ